MNLPLPSSPWTRIVSLAALAALIAAVTFVATTDRGHDDVNLEANPPGERSSTADDPTATTEPNEEPATQQEPSPTTSTADSTSPTSGDVPPTTVASSSAAANDGTPPAAAENLGLGARPGRYTYDQQGEYSGAFGSGELPETALVDVSPSTADGRQTVQSEGDAGAGNLDVIHHADRIELAALSGMQGSIALDPPAEVIRLDAKKGTTWDWQRTTTMGPVAGDFVVSAEEEREIGTVRVRVIAIDYRIEGEAEFQGSSYVYVVEGTRWVSSAHRMIVEDSTAVTVRQKPVAGPAVGPPLISSTSERTLRSLVPA